MKKVMAIAVACSVVGLVACGSGESPVDIKASESAIVLDSRDLPDISECGMLSRKKDTYGSFYGQVKALCIEQGFLMDDATGPKKFTISTHGGTVYCEGSQLRSVHNVVVRGSGVELFSYMCEQGAAGDAVLAVNGGDVNQSATIEGVTSPAIVYNEDCEPFFKGVPERHSVDYAEAMRERNKQIERCKK